jgi:drug/metabolite transporter (DMT)-like permease
MARGQALPATRQDWTVSAVLAIAFIVLGNGIVTWAEQWVPSNQAALIIASSALFTAWFGTFGRRGRALSRATKLGLFAGLGGTALMVWPEGGEAAAQEATCCGRKPRSWPRRWRGPGA